MSERIRNLVVDALLALICLYIIAMAIAVSAGAVLWLVRMWQ